MLKRLLCLIGLHDWRMEHEVDQPGSGFTDNPMDYEVGGVDWHLQCSRCHQTKIEKKRSVWLPSTYQPL